MRKNNVIILIAALCIATAAYAQSASRQDAVNAISKAESDMKEMADSGFSTVSVNDSIISAKQSLERADFAWVIRQNPGGYVYEQAKKALEGLNYTGFSYDDVIKYTDQASLIKQKAYDTSDSIRATEIEIQGYRKVGVNVSDADALLSEAKDSFSRERYDEAQSFALQAANSVENKRTEITILNIIAASGRDFVERNLRQLAILSAAIAVITALSWRRYSRKKSERNLKRMVAEKKSIEDLMKKLQRERFESNKISALVYRVRAEKYQKRLDDLNRKIPVLEQEVKKRKKVGK